MGNDAELLCMCIPSFIIWGLWCPLFVPMKNMYELYILKMQMLILHGKCPHLGMHLEGLINVLPQVLHILQYIIIELYNKKIVVCV